VCQEQGKQAVKIEIVQKCSSCGEEKPLEEFHRNRGKPAGRSDMCRSCRSIYDRTQNAKPERIEKFKQYRQEESTMMRNRERSRQAYINCPEAYKAKALVSRLISLGLIEREPCQVCASEEDIHAHHDDYSRPLEIIWLCRAHHWWIERIKRGEDEEPMPALFIHDYSYVEKSLPALVG